MDNKEFDKLSEKICSEMQKDNCNKLDCQTCEQIQKLILITIKNVTSTLSNNLS